MMRLRRSFAVAASLCLAIAGIRAAEPAPADPPAPIDEREYKIQAGDQLGIKFFYNQELNEEVTVRPDGRISLQLIPEVVAAGRTPADLAKQLRTLYSREMEDPEIAVIVRSFSAQRIYVDGEVVKPGEMPLVGRLTVLQALAQAGGATPVARLREVLLIRREADGTPRVIPLNLNRAREAKLPDQDLSLKPYDIVYVPRSAIGNVNRWVDVYIRRNIPYSFSFRYNVK